MTTSGGGIHYFIVLNSGCYSDLIKLLKFRVETRIWSFDLVSIFSFHTFSVSSTSLLDFYIYCKSEITSFIYRFKIPYIAFSPEDVRTYCWFSQNNRQQINFERTDLLSIYQCQTLLGQVQRETIIHTASQDGANPENPMTIPQYPPLQQCRS